MNKKVSISLAGVLLLTILGAPVAAMADDNQPPVYPLQPLAKTHQMTMTQTPEPPV